MSFSKAKLQRFNETQNYTPSPADYNVAVRSHVAGAAIPKSERFLELRSPSQSDNGSFISNNSVPTFRTPNPPRKLKHQASTDRKTRPVDLFQTADDIEALKEKIVECNNKDLFIQELTEQLEEMKQQLSDLESQIARLNNDKLQLEENLEKLNGDHENALKDFQTNHQLELEKLSEKITEVNNKMDVMKKEYVKLKEENQKDLAGVLQNIATLEELHNALTKSYEHLLEQKKKEVKIKEKQIEGLEEECVSLQKKHTQQMDDIKKKQQMEVQDVEYEMLKTVTEMRKEREKENQNHDTLLKELLALKEAEFNNLQAQFEQEKLKLKNDSDAKIKQLTENYKETSMLAEMQMKEKCNDIEMSWKLKLEETKEESDAILKECQAIAEYNIIQSEIEKNKALYELSERNKDLELLQSENSDLKTDYQLLDDKYRQQQSQLRNIIVELQDVRETLTEELREYKRSVEQLTKDKHTYEVTILKTHKTVETLKKRLMRSDQDVEQLKAELEATEECKLEFEGKCNQLTDELQIVCGLCDDMEEQNELALRVAGEKVAKMEQQLLDKVESYKQQANEQVSNVTKELTKTKEELTNVLKHLYDQQQLNTEAQTLIFKSKEEIERLEQISVEYTIKIDHLEAAFNNIQIELRDSHVKEATLSKTNESLKDENKKLKTVIELMHTGENALVKQVDELREKCKNYEEFTCRTLEEERNVVEIEEMQHNYLELSEKYDAIVQKLNEAEDENCKLRKKVAEQESLIGPFREYLEAYEMEYNALMNQKQDAEKEAKEMGMKYAEILGHQNQKQKIKHLMDLKKKNYELSENKKELEIKVRSQTRTIEKLKKELSAATKSPRKVLQQTEYKENVSSPNRTLNSSRIDSPGGPLRDRN